MVLSDVLNDKLVSRENLAVRTARIHAGVLQSSRSMDGPNFRAIDSNDLKSLFELYDAEFFDGHLRRTLGDRPMYFRLSRRLTSSAGQMTRRTRRGLPRQRMQSRGIDHLEFEISISTTILFQSFTDPNSTTKASGIVCRNRLEALQRVFEHELVHLAETLVWSDSRCSGPRFQSIARRLFGHREHTHQLVTSREHAFTKFGFRVGDWVAFDFEGKRYVGRMNRITRRATVLVEDAGGVRYTDGKHYRKFYIPLTMLERVKG